MFDRLAGDHQLSGPDDEYPDERQDGLKLGVFNLVGASVRGKLHIRNNIGREDAFAVHGEGDWVAVAVSDGVGSSKYAWLGAAFAVNNVCQKLLEEIHKIIKAEISDASACQDENEPTHEQLSVAMFASYASTSADLQSYANMLRDEQAAPDNQIESADTDINASQSSTEIEVKPSIDNIDGLDTQLCNNEKNNNSITNETKSFSHHRPITVSDLHCTLLTLLINVKSGTMAIGQVGDGLILGLTQENQAIPIIEPSVPDQMGQTYAITQKNWDKFYTIRILSREESNNYITLYLMTDGVADDCLYGPPDDIMQIWAREMNVEVRKHDASLTKERLRKHLANYDANGSYDDRTLVVLYKPTTIEQGK